jgi:hypothetical protein
MRQEFMCPLILAVQESFMCTSLGMTSLVKTYFLIALQTHTQDFTYQSLDGTF